MKKIHLTLKGGAIGEFSTDELRDLYFSGKTTPDDLVWHAGAPAWIPLHEFLRKELGIQATPPQRPPQKAIPSSLPPVIPTALPPVIPAGHGVGVVDEVDRAILEGGRFVVYPFAISVLVLSFRRASDVVFLKRGEDGMSSVIGYSAISFLCGWWGFPWGPIFTVQSLYNCLCGGKDVTQEVLTQKVGPARAAEIMARRVRGKATPRLRALQVGVPVCALVFVFLFSLWIGAAAGRSPSGTSSRRAASPVVSSHQGASAASSAFEAANRNLNTFKGQSNFGNNDKALEVATSFTGVLQETYGPALQSSKRAVSTSKGNFMTHCELRDDCAVFMVHVPDLRHIDNQSKELLAQTAYINALGALASHGVTNDLHVAVGIRGALLYDRVLEGNYAGKLDERYLPAAPQVNTIGARDALVAYFTPGTP